jgi:hypothetical protein
MSIQPAQLVFGRRLDNPYDCLSHPQLDMLVVEVLDCVEYCRALVVGVGVGKDGSEYPGK